MYKIVLLYYPMVEYNRMASRTKVIFCHRLKVPMPRLKFKYLIMLLIYAELHVKRQFMSMLILIYILLCLLCFSSRKWHLLITVIKFNIPKDYITK